MIEKMQGEHFSARPLSTSKYYESGTLLAD